MFKHLDERVAELEAIVKNLQLQIDELRHEVRHKCVRIVSTTAEGGGTDPEGGTNPGEPPPPPPPPPGP